MADWKKLLTDILLADGVIDAKETQILKDELLSDGIIDDSEFDFLVDLRSKAKETCDEFTVFFFEALSSNILEDGVIDAAESAKIREIIFADGKIDEDEKNCLSKLKQQAKSLSPEFEKLYSECMK